MNRKKGFTLIEVISVLVILGLLAVIVVTQFSTTINKSRERLNNEQKSRLVEVAKTISLNNKNCLEIAKDNPNNGVKISLDQMKRSGYIANKELKDLEKNANLNSCVIVNWNANYEKFDYNYAEDCSSTLTCDVKAETEKVIVSSFYVGESNVNYVNNRNATYYIKYTSNIASEYCVTLDNEAGCNWKNLDINSNVASGSLKLTNVENIVHLYIRNSNRNIITAIDDAITYDAIAPVCSFQTPSKSYMHNGENLEITLICNDIAGIKNTELSSSAIEVNKSGLVSISNAIVTNIGNSKEFKFTITALNGNGETKLSLKSGIISDTAGNLATNGTISSTIVVDNIAPEAEVLISGTNSNYINNANVTLSFSNVSSDVNKICVSNFYEGNCTYVDYTPTYNWTLPSGDGSKNIYVSFKDKAGNVTKKNVNLYLDTTVPYCISTPKTDNFRLKNGSYADYNIKCVDTNKMEEDVVIDSSMLLIDNKGNSNLNITIIGTSSEGTTIRANALTGDGDVTIYMKSGIIFDAAGNSNVKQKIAEVTVDNTPPFNNIIILNKNTTISNIRNINVELDSDVRIEGGYYCLKSSSDANNCSSSDWITYANSTSFQVPDYPDTYTIYAFFKDLAGNISTAPVSASIKYNQSAIACYLFEETDLIRINVPNSAMLAAEPYSVDLNNWNHNNTIIKENNKNYYFTYVKDNNGETSYCELSIAN